MFEDLERALASAVWADAAAAHDAARAEPLAAFAARAAPRPRAFSSASERGATSRRRLLARPRTLGHALRASRFDPRLRDALAPLVQSVVLQETPTLVATLRTLAR